MKLLDQKTALAYKKYRESWKGDLDSISDYNALGEGTAEILGSTDGSIELNISSLTPQDAASLAKNSEGISFEGIIEIDSATAQALVATNGNLSFSAVIADDETAKIIRSKVEWCTIIRPIDTLFVRELESLIQEGDDCQDIEGEFILTDPGVVEELFSVCQKNDLDPQEVFLKKIMYFSVEGLRAIAENHDPEQLLDFSWRYRYDEKKRAWGRDHIAALAAFRGKEMSLNLSSQILTPENLSLLSEFSLMLNSMDNFGDEYAETLRNWKGSDFMIDNGATITPGIARAIADSEISTFISSKAIASKSVLKELCEGEKFDYLGLCIPIIDEEEAALILPFEGTITTESRHITKAAADILQNAKCAIYPFADERSIYADEETIKLLEKIPGVGDTAPQWVGEEELEWQDRCRLVLDKKTVQDEQFYDYSYYPRITSDLLQEYVSDPNTKISLDGVLIFEEGQIELLGRIEDERHIGLSMCQLSDYEAEVLASIRKASLSFNNLAKVSPKGIAALTNRNARTHFGKGITHFEYNEIQDEPGQDDHDDPPEEKEESRDTDGIEAISFDLGMLRSRLWQKQSPMGGPEKLLESIEQTIKENGLSRKFAMQEAWIGTFLLNCVDGDDTSAAKKAIEDLYWNS